MKKKILLVDDDRSIRALLEFVLSNEFEVVEKEDGLEALIWLDRNESPDLVVVDVKMPKVSGYEFIQNLQASSLYKDIPVIMLSGVESTEEKIKFLSEGASDYVTKPFNPVELLLRIKNIFKKTEFVNA